MKIRLSQPTISHHMAVLQKAGLVEAKKEGLWRWYRRNEAALNEFTRKLRRSL
jgi:ArsR family transcriptional regulator